MMRRPLGHVAPQPKLLLALALVLFPSFPLVDAQQQQQHHQEQREEVARHIQDQLRQPLAAAILDSSDGNNAFLDDASYPNRKPDAANTKSPAEGDDYVPRLSVETPKVQRKRTASSPPERHSKYDNVLIPDDASALATLAPDLSVRAPPPPHRATTEPGYGLATPHTARSLEDWDVEDFVILATVDGDLYATEKKTGKILWHTEIEKPVVNTTHHRSHISPLDDTFHPIDHNVWVVEPNRDGNIYLMTPGASTTGLKDTSLTMKRLVEMTPRTQSSPPVVYMGRKESTMVTLDAATGKVNGWYGSSDPFTNFKNYQPESCLPPSDFDGSAECSAGGTISLGRTDYIVYVSRTDMTENSLIATLRYSEWGPNNFDRDLHEQYHSTRDNQYITSKPDGQVYTLSTEQSHYGKYAIDLHYRLPAPICRVFDIARPTDAPHGSTPELLVLPQPPPPPEDENVARQRSVTVFINEIAGGSFYALSGAAYPLILHSAEAQCAKDGWWESHQDVDPTQLRHALIGKHSLLNSGRQTPKHAFRALPGGEIRHVFDDDEPDNDSTPTTVPSPTEPPNVIGKVKELPQAAANSLVEFLSNPVFILAVLTLIVVYHKDLRRWYNSKKKQWFTEHPGLSTEQLPTQLVKQPAAEPSQAEREVPFIERPVKGTPSIDEETEPTTDITPVYTGESDKENAPAVRVVEPVQDPESPVGVDGTSSENQKRKPHRGRRGGIKHRKGKKRESSLSQRDEPAVRTVDEIVDETLSMAERPQRLEPDIETVPSDVQEVSGPNFRMGSLEVNEDRQLGTGSNGTVVFAGKFDGRDVAVKRMLIQFYDIASQETRLLRESDDHRNVIRYYAQQQRDAFLYIALELCQASLAEIVEKPELHRDLADAGAQDLPGVLYQITNGISHLHSLRIVHRDLKPQNILVNMERDGRPRLLVSDFGLCKKLEGGQSSFGATTAHAAGTSGWRAPELLLDDDARDNGTALIDASSTHSGSGSLISSDLMPNRRATRAIDIFSLGLVFFYVLTEGRHPFDCGDRYMREVNIRKGNYNLDLLDRLGPFAYEAKDLIQAMLHANPKMRPTAESVMSHPFFWPAKKRLSFLCDVSDHFEKEPRDPPSEPLKKLESKAPEVCRGDFLKHLPKDFIDSLGKQRKYTGSRLLDLLRALRNKRNHYEDMPDALRKTVGSLPDGYLAFWAGRFPNLLIECWYIGWDEYWPDTDRFREYYLPQGLGL